MAAQSPLFTDFFWQIYSYREYLWQSVARDLRNKYKRSTLGYLWTMLHPLAMMAILATVFAGIMRMNQKDYAVFLFSGLLAWNYFASTVLMSLASIRHNAKLFSQVPVPKYIFILSVAASNFFNFIMALVPLVALLLFFGHSLTFSMLLIPALVIPLIFTTVGVSLTTATAAVFFDDTHHLTEVGIQVLYFLSPILYAREMLSGGLQKWLVLNPLVPQIEMIRSLFLAGQLPSLEAYVYTLATSSLILAAGLLIFRRNQDKFLYFV